MEATGRFRWLKHADLLLLLLWTWFYASYAISALTQPDQGTFASFGYYLLQGKTLYTDFFDHKPPAIYLLNAAYLALGGVSENSIAYFVMFFALLQVLVFYRLAARLGAGRGTRFMLSLAFITVFFRYELFGTGNFTEQYGVLCSSSALLLFLIFDEKGSRRHLFGAATLFGLGFAFKEPFLLSALPAFGWLWLRGDVWKQKLVNTGVFAAGFVVPTLLTFVWMLASGAWTGYAEHIQHSLRYTSHGEPVWLKLVKYYDHFFAWFALSEDLTLWLYLPALPGLFFSRLKRPVLWLLIGQQLCDYVATSVTGNGWHHYFMQTTPLMVVVMVFGWSGWLGFLLKNRPLSPVFVSAGLLVAAMWVHVTPWKFTEKGPEKHWYDEMERYLDRNGVKRPVSLALAREEFGFYYVRLKAISPTRHIVPYPYHWVIPDESEKQAFLKAEYDRLSAAPPDYIITGTEFAQAWIDAGMDKFAKEHYRQVSGSVMPDGRQVFLLKRK